MKFALLIRSNPPSEAGMLPSKDGHVAMIKFANDLVAAGALADAVGLHPTKDATRVTLSVSPGTDKQVAVTRGPFPATELVGGWWILDVKDEQEAIEWAKKCPLPVVGASTTVEIRRIFMAEDLGPETFSDEMRAEAERIQEKMKTGRE